ncbi:MAG: hypothetical protein ACFFB0_13480 [Promethearchaeota archaeon]
MSLKCQFCGKKIYYDRKICQDCEEIANKSGLSSKDERYDYKWRCDNFLEVNYFAFGSNLDQRSKLISKMIECPECGEEYSYGRNIIHICEHSSIPFGRIFGPKHKEPNWNCDTGIACMDLFVSELDSHELILEGSHLEKLKKNEYESYVFSAVNNNQKMDRTKKLLIYE